MSSIINKLPGTCEGWRRQCDNPALWQITLPCGTGDINDRQRILCDAYFDAREADATRLAE
jgi:hypothetical protein